MAQPPHDVPESEIKGKHKRVIRRATPVDLLEAVKYQAQEEKALAKWKELVKELEIAGCKPGLLKSS